MFKALVIESVPIIFTIYIISFFSPIKHSFIRVKVLSNYVEEVRHSALHNIPFVAHKAIV